MKLRKWIIKNVHGLKELFLIFHFATRISPAKLRFSVFQKVLEKCPTFVFKRWVKNTTRWLSVLSRVKQGNGEQRWQGEHAEGGSCPLLDYCFSVLSMLELGLFGKNLPLKAAE